MGTRRLRRSGLTLTVLAVLATAACSAAESTDSADGISDGTSDSAAPGGPPEGNPLGEPNPATGDPLVFGMLSQEAGPVTFPDVSSGAQAAADYVNEYLGGISGRPIEISTCVTDGQPSSSERCANQILDEDPVAILGAIDVGSTASMPVWERADLAYLGGLPLTPPENLSPNSIQFYQASIGDNAAAAAYAATELEAESAYVIYTDDPQGQALGNEVIIPTLEKGGVGEVESIAVPPSAADLSAPAATAVSANPDVIFVVVPNACANMMLALQAVGNQSEIFTIGPCFAPEVIEAAGSSMTGVKHASPFTERTPASPEGAIFFGALDAFTEGTPPSPLALGGFGTVMNVQAALDGLAPEELTTETILAAFRDGAEKPNFMAHPYTCDGKQLGPFTAACNAFELIYEVDENGEEILIEEDWFSPAEYFS